MRWRIVHDLSFVASPKGDSRERVTLREGEVVETYPEGRMVGDDLVSWKRHQERTVREDPSQKPIAVLWLGKMRLVRAPADVVAAPNLRKLG